MRCDFILRLSFFINYFLAFLAAFLAAVFADLLEGAFLAVVFFLAGAF